MKALREQHAPAAEPMVRRRKLELQGCGNVVRGVTRLLRPKALAPSAHTRAPCKPTLLIENAWPRCSSPCNSKVGCEGNGKGNACVRHCIVCTRRPAITNQHTPPLTLVYG